MKLQHISLFAILLGLSSCMWGVPKKQNSGIVTDTLAYAYQNIKQTDKNCGSADSNCTIVNINYPVFNGNDLLNDTVTKKVLGLFSLNKTDTSLQQMSAEFLRSYNDFKKNNPKSAIYYTLNCDAKVIRQDSSLTTLQISGYSFQGGAHGATSVQFINWNTKTNKNLLLCNILINGYEADLVKTGEAVFRKNEKLSDTASLTGNYFFKNNKFTLSNNFLITPLGIRFLYNEYEIKPYAAGQTNIFIPYTQIKSLLRPNTVVTQYIKQCLFLNSGVHH
jgi:hypothetical protein